MQNRIFRAKESKTDKWIFGSLLIGKTNCFICWETSQNQFEVVPVKSETIGQCTGYFDIFASMIFEGDEIESGHGIKYVIVYTLDGLKAKSQFGFIRDIDSIYQPIKKRTIHDLIE
jgi:hypothetical protein